MDDQVDCHDLGSDPGPAREAANSAPSEQAAPNCRVSLLRGYCTGPSRSLVPRLIVLDSAGKFLRFSVDGAEQGPQEKAEPSPLDDGGAPRGWGIELLPEVGLQNTCFNPGRALDAGTGPSGRAASCGSVEICGPYCATGPRWFGAV
ncbi:hypothetical protein [Actinopolyspora saharensis]|uniref:hypothetical protein n=1 Tax=Actinopolyspora saharensis TaxID=995062 RepID=UPI003F66F89A